MTEQQTKTVELKPCPFCGSTNVYDSSNGLDSHYFNCCDCGAEGPACKNEEAAKVAWNQRTQPLDPSMGGVTDKMITRMVDDILDDLSDRSGVPDLRYCDGDAETAASIHAALCNCIVRALAQPQPKTKGAL